MRKRNVKSPQSVVERSSVVHGLSFEENKRYTITGVRSKDDEDKNKEESNTNYKDNTDQNDNEEQNQEQLNEIQLENLTGNPEKVFEAIIQCIKKDDSITLKNILHTITRPQLNLGDDKIVIEDKKKRTPLWYAAYYGSISCLKVIEQHYLSMEGMKKSLENKSISMAQRNILSISNREISVDSSSKKNSNLFRNSKWGSPPLLIAAARNHPKALSYLINMGAPVTQTNDYGTNVAHIAAHLGHVDILRAIIEHHDFIHIINTLNNLGYTPAIIAAKNGYVPVLKFLYDECCLKQCIQVNFRKKGEGGEGLDCAAIACKYKKASVVSYLLSISDVDKAYLPNFTLKFGVLKDTPLHIACRVGHTETIKLLLQATKQDQQTYRGVNNNKLDSNYLLQTNADGMTAFYLAVYLKYIDVVECFRDMLDEDTLLKVTSAKNTVHNETPLVCAIIKDYDTSFIEILASISDLNVLSKFIGSNMTTNAPPLVVAATRNNIEIVQTLLLLDIDINQRDSRGHTAISIAARNGYFDLCELLARHGADLSIKGNRSGTPLQMAKRYKHWNIVSVLENYGAR